jgi:hypothetical protein
VTCPSFWPDVKHWWQCHDGISSSEHRQQCNSLGSGDDIASSIGEAFGTETEVGGAAGLGEAALDAIP